MEHIVPIYKKIGETPLEALNAFKKNNPEYAQLPMSYAGRLDPMARGILLIVAERALKEKDIFLKLNKKYRAVIAFGLESDTHDILGIVKNNKKTEIAEKDLRVALKSLIGTVRFKLPHFSSYKILGKPLFWWAKEKRIHEVTIPERTVSVFDIKLELLTHKRGDDIKKESLEKISLIHGDFRQNEIIQSWKAMKTDAPHTVATVLFSCSSGTYIRSLAHILGKKLGTQAILLDLERIEIGDYKISDCI